MKKLILILILLFNNTFAQEFGIETGLEIPRYVSLKSNDINIRVGPSVNYPIVLKYVKENYPVMIVEEYEDWRKVIDFRHNSGWIHKSLIKGNRFGIIVINSNSFVKVFNTINGKEIGKIEDGNIIELRKCKQDWCLVGIQNKYGWIKKIYIWGVDEYEIFNIGFLQYIKDIYMKSFNYLEKLINS